MKKCSICDGSLDGSGNCKKTGCTDNPKKPMEIAGTISVFFALLFGLFIWRLVQAFGNGSPFGKVDTQSTLIFYAPIAAFLGPVAGRLFMAGRFPTGCWIVALAPLLGVINFIIVIIISSTLIGPAPIPPWGGQGGWIQGSAAQLRKEQILSNTVLWTTIGWAILGLIVIWTGTRKSPRISSDPPLIDN